MTTVEMMLLAAAVTVPVVVLFQIADHLKRIDMRSTAMLGELTRIANILGRMEDRQRPEPVED